MQAAVPWAKVRSDYPGELPERRPKTKDGAVILLPRRGDYDRALRMWDPAAPIVYILDSTIATAVPTGVPTPLRRVMEWRGWTVLIGRGVQYRPGPWNDRGLDQ